jgi:hypothetical protein
MTVTRTLYALVVAACLLALLMAVRPSMLTGLEDGPREAAAPTDPPSEETRFLAAKIRAKAELVQALLRRELTFAETIEAFRQVNSTPYPAKGRRLVPAPLDEKELRRQVMLSVREYVNSVDGGAAVLAELEREWAPTKGDHPTP